MKYNMVTQDTSDVDFDLDIKDLSINVHSRIDQKAIDQTMTTGFAVLEKGLEKNTKRVLDSIMSSVPKRFLISDHLGMEFSRSLFVQTDDSLTLQA